MVQVQVIQPGETRKRFHRRPNFPIAGSLRAFGLYPIMCHPVLPGETLKSTSAKWTVISQPLVNPFVGAWLESWLFYVKLTDLDRDLGQMFISDTYSTSGWTTGTGAEKYFSYTGGIDWIKKCTQRVHDAYFLSEGETPVTDDVDGGIRRVKLNNRSWYQNLMFEPAETALDVTGERDHDEQMTAWQMVQQMQMTELSYESYLEQYGVQSMRLGIGEPEILRFSRSWTKPTNHVDPASGTPTSAWVWNDEMKLDKDKRFNEPGFVIMLACIRPKMYQAGQVASMISNMWGFSDWYPSYTLQDPAAGIKRIGTDDAVFLSTLNAAEGEVQLLYDHRDLLYHGEQFVNDASPQYALPTATGWSTIAAASDAAVRGEYASNADIQSIFVGTAEDTEKILYEGIVGLTIAGHVTDTTPMT